MTGRANTALPQCVGFGRHEGRCQRFADTPARIWCQRCEDLRRKHISGQFAAVTKSFEASGGHGGGQPR